MRDDEIDDLPDELFPDDPTDFLEHLDAGFEELDIPGEQSATGIPLSRQEIDDIVERTIAEELARLNGSSQRTR